MAIIKKNWVVKPKVNRDFVRQFSQYDELVLQLLFNRGLIEEGEIEEFLNPDYKKYHHDPFSFRQMEAAVQLVIEHIKAGNKIMVYGDYDADGVTASSVLLEILNTFKAKTGVYIPDRVSEGYGLNKAAIEESAKAGFKLIITVDNGIRNKEEVAYAKSLGVDVIITDHHVGPISQDDLPDCLIINPILAGETYPFRYLAGVGVASKLALALIKKSKLEYDHKTLLEERILDLVAVGTIADCVTLLGENRVLVKKGLEMLNQTRRVGLKELIKIAKINADKKLDSWNVGFQISPRLNAAGRMDHANTAFKLLVTKDKKEAEKLAQDLNDRNGDRQKITEDIVFQIISNIEKQPKEDKIVIAVCPSITEECGNWNEGIIGLVAGRICEKYYLPSLVITGNSSEIKGSGRSIEEFNLIKAVEKMNGSLDKYGGHAAACGFSIKGKENLDKFIEGIKSLANQELKDNELGPKLEIESELELDQANEELINVLDMFSPFGEDNDRPIFVSRNINIVDISMIGVDGRHLRLKVRKENSKVKSALGFGLAEEWKNLRIGDKIDLAYFVDLNEFNGRREVQLKIVDIKLST